MCSKLKILMVGPRPPQIGGIEFVVEDLLQSKLAEWCEVHHLDISKPKSRSAQQFKSVAGYARSFNRPLRMSLYSFGYSVCHFFKMLYRLATGGDQVVNLHSSSYLSYWEKCVYLDLAKLFGKKVVVHIHGSAFDSFVEKSGRWTRRLLLWHLRRFDRVIALSPFWFEFFQQYLSAEKIALVETGIRTADYLNRVNEAAPFPSIVFIGEVCKRKGIYDLLPALAELAKTIPDIRLIVVGPGEVEEAAGLAQRLGVATQVEFVGPRYGMEKLAYLQQAWCFCLPSYAEVFPVVILEAMACGLPVVSTFTGGVPDAVQDGRNGLLVPAGDRPALTAALSRVLLDGSLRRSMGEANRQRAIERYDVTVSAAKLRRIYGQVCATACQE
ncbi:MAG TPA: glycosyltransferase family 4 protein [bacterium]|nr:glycosyltransferase family 4 protein [bacterium]